jgi:predicted enzyme related to lactoylglutathione lyase
MRVTGIGWTGILTEDFEAMLGFVSAVLGLTMAHRDEAKELAHFRFRSGQLLEVFGPGNRKRKPKYRWFSGPALGFEVDDVELALQEMTARGVRFIGELESWESDRWAMFLGPEDQLFEIVRQARSPAGHSGHVVGMCRASVSAKDFAGAMQFFSQVMEIPLVQQDDGQEAARCWLPAGHLFGIFGAGTRRNELTSHCVIGFEVDHVAQARQTMESQGIEFLGPIEVQEDGNAWTYFHAPDGFIYELASSSKPPAR